MVKLGPILSYSKEQPYITGHRIVMSKVLFKKKKVQSIFEHDKDIYKILNLLRMRRQK